MKRAAAPFEAMSGSTPEAKRAKVETILRKILDGTMAPEAFPVLQQHMRSAQRGHATLQARNCLLASTDERLQHIGRLCATTVTANSKHTLCLSVRMPARELALSPRSLEQMTPYGSHWTLQLQGSENLRFGFCQPELHVRHPVPGTYHVTFALVGGAAPHESVTATVQAQISPTQTKAVLPSPFLTGAGEAFLTSPWVTDGYFQLQVTVVREPTAAQVASAVKPLLTQAMKDATRCWETRELLDHLTAAVELGPLLKRLQVRQAMDAWIEKHAQLLARMPSDQVPATPGHAGPAATDGSTASAGLKERIRKMLQLGLHPDTPESEATQSMRLAQQLMAKHQLQQAELGLHRKELTGGMVKVTLGRGLPAYRKLEPVTVPQWIYSLMSVCSSTFSPDRKSKVFYNVHQGRCPTVTFYGFREAAQLAAYAFQVAIDRIVVMKEAYVPDMAGLATSRCQSKAAFTRLAKLTYCKGIVSALRQAIPPPEAAPAEAPTEETTSTPKMPPAPGNTLALVVQHHEAVATQVLRDAGIHKVRKGRTCKKYASFDRRSWKQGQTDGAALDLQQRALGSE